MSETAAPDGDATAPEESEAEPAGAEAPDSVSDLLQLAGRDVATLARRELELATARHSAELRRTASVVAVALGGALALLTAFALGNWAAAIALSSALPEWLAPLVLAAGWIAVGVVLLGLARRSAEGAAWRRWSRAMQTDPADQIAALEQARDEARQAMGDSLEKVTGTLAKAAGEQIGKAALPLAGGAVVGVSEEIVDAADRLSDSIEDAVPGGGVMNRAVDIVLVPGRLGIKMTRTFLTRGDRPRSR